MHVERLTIQNIRSIERLDIELESDELAGWHVLLGDNGTGKSTIVRALALTFMGMRNADATRQDWSRWVGAGGTEGLIDVWLTQHPADRWTGQGRTSQAMIQANARIRESTENLRNGSAWIELSSDSGNRTVWGGGEGWFSASFGPFRRFSGGEPQMDRLYHSHPRLAPHLSAFGDDVALGECLRWLRDLHVGALENEGYAAETRDAVISFVNHSGLLPHGARIDGVTSEQVTMADGRNTRLSVEEMSDGYRSILSLTFELLRLMFEAYGTETALAGIEPEQGTVSLPGVVSIDEVDAHLHPLWQHRVGDWFVRCFPAIQFLVTTHSPIICRAAERGSVWLLPSPDSGEQPRRIVGDDLNRLIYGNILDAFGTELFGEGVTRSPHSRQRLERLAQLNRRRLREHLSSDEREELRRLQATMTSNPSVTTLG